MSTQIWTYVRMLVGNVRRLLASVVLCVSVNRVGRGSTMKHTLTSRSPFRGYYTTSAGGQALET